MQSFESWIQNASSSENKNEAFLAPPQFAMAPLFTMGKDTLKKSRKLDGATGPGTAVRNCIARPSSESAILTTTTTTYRGLAKKKSALVSGVPDDGCTTARKGTPFEGRGLSKNVAPSTVRESGSSQSDQGGSTRGVSFNLRGLRGLSKNSNPTSPRQGDLDVSVAALSGEPDVTVPSTLDGFHDFDHHLQEQQHTDTVVAIQNGASVNFNDEELAIANPVMTAEDMNVQNQQAPSDGRLICAEEFDPVKRLSSVKMQRQRDAFRVTLLVLIGLVAVTGATLLAVFWTSESAPDVLLDSSSSNNNNNNSLTPSAAPSVFSRYTWLMNHFDHGTVAMITVNNNTAHSMAFQWVIDDPYLLQYDTDRIHQRFALAVLFYATDGANWAQRTHWLDYSYHECTWWPHEACGLPCGNNNNNGETNQVWSDVHCPASPIDEYSGLTKGNLNTSYVHLWLPDNNMVGTLPQEVFWLTSLQTLTLGGNRLEGSIPSRVGALTDLLSMELSGTDIGGTLPTEIGELGNLDELSIIATRLTGTLPSQLGRLSKLSQISLDENQISGTIPRELGMLSNLQGASLANNNLSGTLPIELGGLVSSSLLALDVSGNDHLFGTIPEELCSLNSSGCPFDCMKCGLSFDCSSKDGSVGQLCGCGGSCICADP